MSFMPEHRRVHTTSTGIAAICAVLLVLVLPGTALAQSEPVTESFEIGDGVEPFAPGTGDVLGASLQNGPDWGDLFAADRTCKDVYDEFGNAGLNGMPDFLDTWGYWKLRRDGGFLFDDVSGGTGTDATVFGEGGALGSGEVPPAFDLGNAYAYAMFTKHKQLMLYAGLERLSVGTATVALEFNRNRYVVDSGVIEGARTVGDVRIVLDFGASGMIALELQKWVEVDPETGAADWTLIESLPIDQADPAEQCNAVQSLCVVSNAGPVAGGDWDNYGADGAVIGDLAPNTFVEFGINLSALIGIHTYDNFYATRYVSVQVMTYDDATEPNAIDYALGHFARAARLAQ